MQAPQSGGGNKIQKYKKILSAIERIGQIEVSLNGLLSEIIGEKQDKPNSPKLSVVPGSLSAFLNDADKTIDEKIGNILDIIAQIRTEII